MSKTTRRGLLVGALLVPTLVRVSPFQGRHLDGLTSDRLAQLQRRRDGLITEIQELDRQWRIANELLPSWCQLGPKYQDEQGRTFGSIVGWPETSVHLIQIDQRQWLVRPSPYDLRELFTEEVRSLGRNVAMSNYRVRAKQLQIRLRRRREIHQSVGLPKSRDWLPLDLRLEEVEAAISSLLTGEQLVSHSGQRSSQVADHSSDHLVPHGHS